MAVGARGPVGRVASGTVEAPSRPGFEPVTILLRREMATSVLATWGKPKHVTSFASVRIKHCLGCKEDLRRRRSGKWERNRRGEGEGERRRKRRRKRKMKGEGNRGGNSRIAEGEVVTRGDREGNRMITRRTTHFSLETISGMDRAQSGVLPRVEYQQPVQSVQWAEESTIYLFYLFIFIFIYFLLHGFLTEGQ